MTDTFTKISASANLFFMLLTVVLGFKVLELNRKVVNVQVAAFSYQVGLEGSALVLKGNGESFFEPTEIRVTPFFDTGEPLPEQGFAFTVPLNLGEIEVNEKTIKYPGVLFAVCDYVENQDYCRTGGLSMLEVRTIVNEKSDTDVIAIPKA